MVSDTSKALSKRSSDSSLMLPPPPPKRIKRPPKVLDEDEYTDALSHIIARDFFPGLLETQTQQEYLDAVSSKDRQWIAEAGRKLTEVMTPGPAGRSARGRRGVSMTPSHAGWAGETPTGWRGETPMSVAGSEASTAQTKPPVDLNMSLSAFQAKYTSEDNESFNALLDKQNEKQRAKTAYLWNGNTIPTARQLTSSSSSTSSKLLTSTPASNHKDKQLVRTTHAPDTRPPSLDHRPTNPRNPLMFAPDSIEDTHPTTFSASLARSNIPPKQTLYHNTRLPTSPKPPSQQIPPSPSLSAIDAAIARRPRPTASEPGTTSPTATPRVAGYAFVDASPSPPPPPAAASEEEEEEEEDPDPPSLTHLLPRSSSPNPFTLAPTSARESLHHRLVDRAAKANKEKNTGPLGKVPALEAGTPRFWSSPRVHRGEWTPAGRRLWEKVGGGAGATPRGGGGGGEVFGRGSPRVKGKVTPRVTPRGKRAGA